MANNNATILIPDISGFTEFMTSTELNHGTYAINLLMDAMLKTVGDEYDVSEIEGDAVLLIRKGPAPTKTEIQQTCVNIFNSFHYQRMWMQQHAICPCGACVAIADLTLKFIAHHGPVAEIKVGRFVKQSGPEMIVAHRLLKNSIDNSEYLLISEKLSNHFDSISDDLPTIKWTTASEVYNSIGKVNYQFALLNDARKGVPTPLPVEMYKKGPVLFSHQAVIMTNFRDVYMSVMDIPSRPNWVPDLESVDQDIPGVFIGSVHRCKYKQFLAVLSPRHMNSSPDVITYAEGCSAESQNLDLIYEYQFRKQDEHCVFTCGVSNISSDDVPADLRDLLLSHLEMLTTNLKALCEQMQDSFFDPLFQKQ